MITAAVGGRRHAPSTSRSRGSVRRQCEDSTRARRLGRGRAVGRAQPASTSERPDPGRSARPGRRRGGHVLELRLRDLRPDPRQGHRHRRGPGPDLGSAAVRHLAQPAGQAGGHHRRRLADGAGLRQRPVHSADPAGSRLPVPAVDARGHRRRAQRLVRPGRGPGRGRRRSRRAAAGLHRRPGRDRGRHHLAAGDRPLPDGAQGADLDAQLHPDLGHRAGAGQGAQRDLQVDDRRRRRSPSAWPTAAPATASSASRVTARPATGRPPPGCWTGSSPRSGTS